MTRREFVAGAVAWGPVLERQLPAGFEYWLARVDDGRELATRWEGDAALGSLVKPFVALAYGTAREFRYPQIVCRAGACWLPAGHGAIAIEAAIAHSCNAYFTAIAQDTPGQALELIANQYGLPAPEAAWTAEVRIGRYGWWKAEPAAIARAYCELAHRRSDAGVSTVMAGMRLCAREGTAAGARARIAAKTGTAPCCHARRSSGDGLVAALFPDDMPRHVLLARAHGKPGAEAARLSSGFFRVAGAGR